MSSIKDLEEKVKKYEEQVQKSQKTIEKRKKTIQNKILAIKKFMEQHNITDDYDEISKQNERWYIKYQDTDFFNELWNHKYDIDRANDELKSAEKKLKSTEDLLQRAIENLRKEKAKLQYIQDEIPQVIKDFLLNWKNSVIKYINNLRDSYMSDYNVYKNNINKFFYEYIINHIDDFHYIHRLDEYDYSRDYAYEMRRSHHFFDIKSEKGYIELTEKFNSKYNRDALFIEYKRNHFDDNWLDEVLNKEMNKRLIDLMNKVSKITGKIIDADLYIEHGDLNGIVVGEDGKARVTTIGAAGYNIQRYHYRCLIKPIKD